MAKGNSIIGELADRYPQLAGIVPVIESAKGALCDCFASGGKVLVCGNGGSAADALHIVGELMKAFVRRRDLPLSVLEELRRVAGEEDAQYIFENLEGSLPVLSLVSETALMTAYANDRAPDLVFAQQVHGLGRQGDLLLAISTSGNSRNVVFAAQVAKAKGMQVISLTGKGGGRLRGLSGILLDVPETETYKIQELHLPVYHALCLSVEEAMFPAADPALTSAP